jgi:hypothetical protein
MLCDSAQHMQANFCLQQVVYGPAGPNVPFYSWNAGNSNVVQQLQPTP